MPYQFFYTCLAGLPTDKVPFRTARAPDSTNISLPPSCRCPRVCFVPLRHTPGRCVSVDGFSPSTTCYAATSSTVTNALTRYPRYVGCGRPTWERRLGFNIQYDTRLCHTRRACVSAEENDLQRVLMVLAIAIAVRIRDTESFWPQDLNKRSAMVCATRWPVHCPQ